MLVLVLVLVLVLRLVDGAKVEARLQWMATLEPEASASSVGRPWRIYAVAREGSQRPRHL